MSKIIIQLVFYTDSVIPLCISPLSGGCPSFYIRNIHLFCRHTARITSINNAYWLYFLLK